MKKFLALIVACVAVASSYATTTFSSSEFMTAAPVMMKGTLKASTWMLKSGASCAVDKGKVSFPVYFSFCQPCINCMTCDDTSLILTNAALYIVDKNSKAKTVDITVVEFDALEAEVTTGKAGKSAKKGDVVMTLEDLGTQATFGDVSDITLFGNWNQKTWFSGNDIDSEGAKVSAIMGIIQKLDGCVDSSYEDYFWACGTLALRRDDSFTKSLMMAMTDDTKGSVNNPFLNCGTVDPELDTCEQVMTFEDDFGYTMVQNYILKKSSPKGYDVDIHEAGE